jgi:hypothetical protein
LCSATRKAESGRACGTWTPATGEKKVLVSAAKLASLDPDVNKVKNEREKERLHALPRCGVFVGAGLEAPDF